MRWLSRRHRGSQTEDLTPVVRLHVAPPGASRTEAARVFTDAFAELRTARQALTASLRNADFLAEGHVQALADGILLDLDEAGLEIVAREDIE